MKKVLILEGSPRRSGNFSILSDEFARGAKEAGAVLGIGAMEAGEIRESAAMAEAYQLGRSIQ